MQVHYSYVTAVCMVLLLVAGSEVSQVEVRIPTPPIFPLTITVAAVRYLSICAVSAIIDQQKRAAFITGNGSNVWAHIWRDMKQVAHETLLVRPSTDVFHSKCPFLGLAAVATRLKHDFGTRSLRPAAPCLSFNAPGRTQLRSSRAAETLSYSHSKHERLLSSRPSIYVLLSVDESRTRVVDGTLQRQCGDRWSGRKCLHEMYIYVCGCLERYTDEHQYGSMNNNTHQCKGYEKAHFWTSVDVHG
ncbi:uncharacterized protein EV420DRAFT_1488527 [Desarmillaria tabescens]|uniref:Uncharacterized protein n=1 Tax=Armillaria tabescens TaxID=1929756 RepID=A0AA39J4H5_ARMTA|nr:uncharacterized protein EV420DRAFT_1488527 [Desarmillaria tabescens]KAK0434679.1 hypothetical protein EV420DRAFT_1488527 [Desarmillaria tabescens]